MSVSDLCDELDILPTTFYQWQKQFFENGAALARKPAKNRVDPKDKKIAKLDEKLDQKNEVIAEILAEHVQLRKDLEGSNRASLAQRQASGGR